jgi:hypothetical protein
MDQLFLGLNEKKNIWFAKLANLRKDEVLKIFNRFGDGEGGVIK